MFDNVQSLYKQYVNKPDIKKFIMGVDIRDQRLPFMFEVIDPATGIPSASFILPFNPEGYIFDPVFRSSVTMTQGGSFEDKIGLGLPKISLSGTFGYLGTLPEGSNARHIDFDKKDSWALYREVEDMLLEFHKRFGTSDGTPVTDPVDQKNLPELRFYNYCDKHFYVIQLQKFRVSRNISRRHLYQYDIQMIGIKSLKEPTYDEDTIKTLFEQPQVPSSMGPWDKIMMGYSQVMSGMDKVISAVQGVQADLAQVRIAVIAFRQGVSAVIAAPFALVRDTIKTIDTIIDTVVSVKGIPQEFITQMRESKRELLQLTFHKDKFLAPITTIAPIANDKTEIVTVALPADQTLVTGMNTPETTLFAADQETVQSVAAKEVPVMDNDTIESIAFRTLGNSSAWRRLADLNGLEYPFVAKGLDAYSPVLETGRLVLQDGPILSVVDITPKTGEIVVLGEEAGVVIDYQNGKITLQSPLAKDYQPGTTITRHERALAVIKPNDKVKVPGNSQSQSSILLGDDKAFATRLYGTDEYLDDVGNQQQDIGDIDTASGLDNLVMQLQHRLKTLPGELLNHPTYGSYLPKIIGKITTDLWLERALLEAEISVLSDPRIEKVKRINFRVENTAIYIDASVVPVGQTNPQSISILFG
jgi:hypothetical protein